MKYSHSLAVLFALLPVFAQALPQGNNFQGFKGGANANKGATANKGGNNANAGKGGNAASTTSVAASAASSTAAAAASSAAATGNNGGNNAANNSNDPQTSLTLIDSVIAKGFANNGQDQPEAGQVASLTSTNNFINFCATVANLPITNGQQITTGSCNPAPMGVIAAQSNMPSSKFVFPKNGQTIAANQDFTIQMAIQHLNTGAFVNPNENYFAAPQTVASNGDITGHSHVVVEALTALDQTTPLDPTKFAFFKGLNSAAQGGILTADVAGGLPAGTYRLASINSAANHQPVLVAVAQHGSLDDMVYFTVANGGAATGTGNNAAGASTTTAAAAASATASVGAIKGKNTGTNGAQGGFAGGNAAKGRGRGRRV